MTIQSVKITNLYGNNYEWQLNPDVNILVGANGTYKSTLLNHIEIILWETKSNSFYALENYYKRFNTTTIIKNDDVVIDASKKYSKNEQTKLRQSLANTLLYTKDSNLPNITDTNKHTFIKLINSIFTNNEITNNLSSKYTLSTGEQSLYSLLLRAAHLPEKSIVFLDNPEHNLHVDWQRNLIKWIKELNPSCQLIMTTHSPTIWYQGWINEVTHIEDIKVN